MAAELEVLYRPINVPDFPDQPNTTPKAYLDKSRDYRVSYGGLESDLQQETGWIQTKLLYPAMEAKEAMAPLKKTIKKREDYKLDYERYQSRTDHARQKGTKSARDEAALAKHEGDLTQAVNVRALSESVGLPDCHC